MNDQNQKKIIAVVEANDRSVIKDFWYFAKLSNRYFSRIGVQSYLETTEKGFALFASSTEDFKRTFRRPKQENTRFKNLHEQLKEAKARKNKELKPFFWSVVFVQKPKSCEYETLLSIVENYWSYYMAIVEIAEGTSKGPRIIVKFLDSKLYKEAKEFQINLIKAHLEKINRANH